MKTYVLGGTDVSVMYVSENNNLQMTTMHWPLTHVRLEGGRLLLEIILFCSKNALSDGNNDELDGVKKNPYRFNFWRKLMMSDNCTTTKLQWKTSPDKVRKVSSKQCCVEKMLSDVRLEGHGEDPEEVLFWIICCHA